jgi:quercetin dioxygenase-like cupin family protein
VVEKVMAEQLSLCTTEDSGWRPDGAKTEVDFQTSGRDLVVELRQWRDGETLDVAASPGDELAAVLGGRFEIRCGDECYVLDAGNGILVPRGEPHRWRALSNAATLYRVTSLVPPRVSNA